jgi:sporulation protein YlmC with PRC-barrel domain
MFGKYQIIGLPVVDNDGMFVGRVRDVFIDKEMHIQGILVDEYLIARHAIREITYRVELNCVVEDRSEHLTLPEHAVV